MIMSLLDKTSSPVSVIINVYNEVASIEAEIRKIHEVIISKIPGSEFIVAEDGSTDGTKEIIGRLVGELGIIHSTSRERKGYAKALKDAFLLARCPYVFYSDTGNKHDPEDFWRLYPFCRDYGLVIGVKANRKDQWYRRLLTWAYNKLISLYFKVDLTDIDSGFRIYRCDVVEQVFKQPWINRELIASEITLRVIASGFKVKEVPISYQMREGKSRALPLKKIPGVIYRILVNLPRLRRSLNEINVAKY